MGGFRGLDRWDRAKRAGVERAEKMEEGQTAQKLREGLPPGLRGAVVEGRESVVYFPPPPPTT